jgi:hypothetical protein
MVQGESVIEIISELIGEHAVERKMEGIEMSKSDRTVAWLFLLLISAGGAAFVVPIIQVLNWAPILLSSVSWNGGVV